MSDLDQRAEKMLQLKTTAICITNENDCLGLFVRGNRIIVIRKSQEFEIFDLVMFIHRIIT